MRKGKQRQRGVLMKNNRSSNEIEAGYIVYTGYNV